ncbi:hypothetical protein IFM61606_02637 [Aspergillus udagawae]|nr:hypothetical protein IFM61606_02637 [Aspergillus udagawae]
MSLTSPKRSPQRGPVFPRRSRRLAGQTPEVDTWTAARARQRSVSMSRRQQSLNGMTEPSETFTNLVDAARARVESYVNGERPTKRGQTSVARNIVNAGNDDQKLWQVFQDLLACLLYPMMAESPIPSEPESPFNFSEPNLEVFAGMLIQPEVRDSDFRDECARRDDCRCCVTGHLDTTKWKQNGYLPDDEPHGDVECADIIPCNYTSWTGSEGRFSKWKSKLDEDARFWLEKSEDDVKISMILVNRRIPEIALERQKVSDAEPAMTQNVIVWPRNNDVLCDNEPLVIEVENLFLRKAEIPRQVQLNIEFDQALAAESYKKYIELGPAKLSLPPLKEDAFGYLELFVGEVFCRAFHEISTIRLWRWAA